MSQRLNKKLKKVEFAETSNTELPDNWPSLTGLRGLAALWVFLLHIYLISGASVDLWSPLIWLMKMGGMGVDIFFTLSAFLLSIPFAEATFKKQAPPDLRHYAKRRFFRIFPAYYFQILIILTIFMLGLSFGMPWSSPTVGGVLAHSILWINAWPLVQPYVPTWWTLPVEFGFYLLLPWLALLMTDRRWYWLLALIVLSLLYRQCLLGLDLTFFEHLAWEDQLPGRLFQFLIGMLAAFFFVRWRFREQLPNQKSRNLLILFSSIILVSLPALGWLYSDQLFLGAATAHPILALWHLYASVCIAVLLLAISSGRNFADRFLQSMPLQWLGRISYGLYLWHYPVIILLRENMGGVDAASEDFLSFFISSFLISITLAFLSWHWLEAPILRRVGSGAA